MCTVMTTPELFGRTMDFPPRTPWHLTYLPAGFQWRPATEQCVITNRYRILGGMRHFDGHYLIGDAVNDHGLLCAELFFPLAASYARQAQPGTIVLTPQDFIAWVVGCHSSVADLAADLGQVTVVAARWYDGNNYPFHWLLQDNSGTYVLEPLAGRLCLQRNPTGVLTNTPPFADQLRRLNRQWHLTGSEFNQQVATAYPGPWPSAGDSVARFQRTVRQRWQAPPTTAASMQYFLRQVTVPNTPQHRNNYTHYWAVFDRASDEYWFTDCQSMATVKKRLVDLTGPRALTF